MLNHEQSIQLANLVNTGRKILREEDVYGLIPDLVTGSTEYDFYERDLIGVDPKDLAADLEFDPDTKHEKAVIVTELGVPVIAVVEQSHGLNLVDKLVVNLYPADAPVEVPYLMEEGGPIGYKPLANDRSSQLVIPYSENAQLSVAKVKNDQGTGFRFVVTVMSK